MRCAAIICCRRVSRTLTSANSAATKNAFAATSSTTATIRSTTKVAIGKILAAVPSFKFQDSFKFQVSSFEFCHESLTRDTPYRRAASFAARGFGQLETGNSKLETV